MSLLLRRFWPPRCWASFWSLLLFWAHVWRVLQAPPWTHLSCIPHSQCPVGSAVTAHPGSLPGNHLWLLPKRPHLGGHKIIIPLQKCLENLTPFSNTSVEIPTTSCLAYHNFLFDHQGQSLLFSLPFFTPLLGFSSHESNLRCHSPTWSTSVGSSLDQVQLLSYTRSVYMELFISTKIYSHISLTPSHEPCSI